MRIYSYKSRDSRRPSAKQKGILSWLKLKLLRRWKYSPRKFWTFIFRLAAAGVLFSALLFLYYAKDLPDPNKLLDRNVPESTKIYARDGSLLYEIHGEYKRTRVNLDQISEDLKHATIAVEDKDFYKHGGISFTGILRAAITDIFSLRLSQGGSTITQQFVKKAILSDDKSFDRKIREIILAIAIDARFSKDEILQFYLNEIPYGRNAYGIEAAAQTYFGKSAKDLSVAESAYLAALPQAPTYYNPSGPNLTALERRKNTILSLMKEQGYIQNEQAQQAKEEKVVFKTINASIAAPHFTFYVQDYLASKYGEKTLEEGGLKVYTTLDPRLQKIAEEAVKTGAEKNIKLYNAHNAALVAIDPKTGQILAMVGSRDYFATSTPAGCKPGRNCLFEPNVNAAVSEKQPGSSFKPYVYVTAFKKEFSFAPASMLIDVTTNFGTYAGKSYIPHNYDGAEHGPLSMRQALAGSLNIPAVKTLALIGVQNATQTARDLGITSPMADCGLSLVLGGCDVKLIDHVAAFSVFANGGLKNDKTAILKIEGKDGKILEEYESSPKQILDPQTVYELTSIMTDNNARSFIFGSRSPLILPDRTVAAKTGTTNNWHDGWTLGFTPSLAAGVWAGNNPGPGTPGTDMKKGADGVLVAAPIWNAFMKEALKDTPAEDFIKPSGIKNILVDEISGKLPTQFSPSTKTEVFADYAVPTDYDDVHVGIALDSLTGQPATPATPPDRITYKTYTVFHSEKRDNPDWENPVLAWALAHGYNYPEGGGSFIPPSDGQGPEVAILEPQDNATIFQLPFKVSASAVSQNPIARVDLSIDGQFVTSLNSAPFVFEINKNYGDGSHTLAIKAVDNTGATSDTSISINVSLNLPLQLIEPTSGLIIMPLTLKAESGNFYSEVSFYYQKDSGTAKLIGKASDVSNLAGKYQYTLNWEDEPGKGNYFIFAQAKNGVTSPKVKVNIP